MNATYNYSIPFNNNLWKLTGFFLTLALFGALVPFELNARRMSISNHTLLFGGLIIGGLFLLIAIILKIKSDHSKQNPNKIELNELTLQVPVGKKDLVKIQVNTILSAAQVGNKYNGSILQIKTNTVSIKPLYIQANGFNSNEEFLAFEALLGKSIGKV